MSKPDTGEQETYVGGTELERVVLAEVRRIGRVLDALAERVEERLDAIARDTKAEQDKLELRLRSAEIELVKLETKIATWASVAGVVGSLVGAGSALLVKILFH